MKEKDEPAIGLDKLGEPIIDPAPDKPPTWERSSAGKALFKGGNWGMAAGLAVAYYYMSLHSPLGFYGGDVVLNAVLLLLSGVGLGFMLGALLGWLSALVFGKDKVPATSFLDDPPEK